MSKFIRYDWINAKVIDRYDTQEEVIKSADEFYHDTFQFDEDYDKDKKIETMKEAIELYEGSAYAIYVEVIEIIKALEGV